MKLLLPICLALIWMVIGHTEEPKKMLHPNFPIIEGRYQMTDNWAVTLDQKYNRRIDAGSLVIWRPGFTIWAIVWNLKEGETSEQRLQTLKKDTSKEAKDVKEDKTEMPYRLSYLLSEESGDRRQPAFYGYAIGPSGQVQIAIYFDSPEDLKHAQEIFQSLTPTDKKSEPSGTANPPKADG